MTLKIWIVSSVLFLAGTGMAAAQDKIYLHNGGIIDASVKEVAPGTIRYKKQDNPDGPDFVIRKGEVDKIRYANGTEDRMEAAGGTAVEDRRTYGRRERPSRSNTNLRSEPYGKNIISLAPVQMANESAAGVGLHYERVLDRNYLVSFYLPFALIFQNQDRYNGSNYETRTNVFKYFYPGIKIYPTGSNRKVSYALGASAALGFGRKYVYDDNGSQATGLYRERDIFRGGLLLNNSLNVQPSKNIYLGVELGVGFTYYDDESRYRRYTPAFGDEPMVQFNFKAGYRF